VSLEVFFPDGVEPQLGGDLLLKYYEQQCLWLGGTSESRVGDFNKRLVLFMCFSFLLCVYLSVFDMG
jgi:hypothetical protein